MSIFTHAILGMIIGKVTGNYGVAMAASILVDSDHIIALAKNKTLFHPKELWKSFSQPQINNETFQERNYFHNILIPIVLGLIAWFTKSGILSIITMAYVLHIITDMFDDANYHPFFPHKAINIKGPIRYFSTQELALDIILLAIWIFI